MTGRNLTEGSVAGHLIRFALPFLLSSLLQVFYGLADLFIVGQFCGTAHVTAVSIGSQIMHVLTVVIVGLAMGSTVAIAHAVGAGDRHRAALATGNTVSLFLSGSLVLGAGLFLGAGGVVLLLSTPAEAANFTLSYLRICFAGIPFITAYNVLSSIFRGLGDSRRPTYFVAAACVLNIVLDYLFVGALSLGAAGAALGTTLAQAVSVILAFLVLRRTHPEVQLHRQVLRPRRNVCRQLLGVGAPIAVQDGFLQLSFLLITVFANRRGLSDAAAVGIVEKVIGILFLVPSAMLSSVSALAAQNLGAEKPDRALRTLYWAVGIAVGFGVLSSLIVTPLSVPIVALFDRSPEVVRLGGSYLRSYVWDCVFAGIHFSFSGYFCAAERSGLSFLHNALSVVLVRIPGAYLASVRFPDTLFPMGLAAPAGSLFSAVLCGVFLWRILRRSS